MLRREISSGPENKRLRSIIINALIIRVIALVLIALSGNWEASFLGGDGVSDDWKYEQGALLYKEEAKEVLDSDAFTWAFNHVDSTDWTGYHLNEPISKSVLWYLIVCALVWITNTKYSIRFFNAILASISIKYIYNFAYRIWGEETADRASSLYAYLPYPVIFCSFGYKEQLVLFCTFYLLSHSADYRTGEKISILGIIKMMLVSVILMGIRSGVSLILLFVCACIMLLPKHFSLRIPLWQVILCFFAAAAGILLFIRFGEAVLYKAEVYLSGERGGTGGMSFLMMNHVYEVWKLPFAYMYSIMMPLALYSPLQSWASVIANVNICMIPISTGCMLYLLLKKKQDQVVYWSTIGYYLIYEIASLNIFRQYYALLPLNLIYYSAYVTKAGRIEKALMFLLAAFMLVVIACYFAI